MQNSERSFLVMTTFVLLVLLDTALSHGKESAACVTRPPGYVLFETGYGQRPLELELDMSLTEESLRTLTLNAAMSELRAEQRDKWKAVALRMAEGLVGTIDDLNSGIFRGEERLKDGPISTEARQLLKDHK